MASRQVDPYPLPPTRILKVNVEALTGFGHIFSSDGPTIHCSLKGASLKMTLAVGMMGKNYIPNIQGRNKEPLIAHVQFLCPADDLLQKYFRLKVFFTSISLPLSKI